MFCRLQKRGVASDGGHISKMPIQLITARTSEVNYMIRKTGLVALALGLMTIATYAASNASDQSSDPVYSGGFNNGTNGGTGFQPWSFSDFDGGGQYIGPTGESASSFGFYGGGAPGGAFADDSRGFAGPLDVGQTFSVNVGIGAPFTSGGNVGIRVFGNSGADVAFGVAPTLTGQQWYFRLDDGFLLPTGIPFVPATATSGPEPVSFSFTVTGFNSFNVHIVEGSNVYDLDSFTDAEIDGLNGVGLNSVEFFSIGQDAGGNLGADNLSITGVPEPSTICSGVMAVVGLFVLRGSHKPWLSLIRPTVDGTIARH